MRFEQRSAGLGLPAAGLTLAPMFAKERGVGATGEGQVGGVLVLLQGVNALHQTLLRRRVTLQRQRLTLRPQQAGLRVVVVGGQARRTWHHRVRRRAALATELHCWLLHPQMLHFIVLPSSAA